MASAKPSQKWVPLECSPEVFNSWAKQAGLVLSQDCFHEVLGLDEELLGLIPRPVKAVILIFPNIGEVAAKHDQEDDLTRKDGTLPIDPTVLWVKQTIGNACGTMAIFHALANSNVTFAPHSALTEFTMECQGKSTQERSHLLENTPLFTDIHTNLASQGQSIVTEEVMDTPLHYSAFVAAPEPDLRKKATPPVAEDLGPISQRSSFRIQPLRSHDLLRTSQDVETSNPLTSTDGRSSGGRQRISWGYPTVYCTDSGQRSY
ncbi:hypothetical protein ONZ45_g9072 [Pleurotus djamor]|nr:hypothetical protein ONZ45_g9072 [Pleurotus djamor]